ncbi:MAG: class I SAM-dependent methyltransferase [Ignavibacteriales bacterium]
MYIYPDTNDTLITSFINEYEIEEGYWKRSEDYIIRLMKKYIKDYIPSSNRVLMDAGCGIGRLIPVFEKMFSKIYAVEPDNKRFLDTKKTLDLFQLNSKVECINTPIREVTTNQKFDIIICSHVIQHIPISEVETTIKKFNKLIAEDGILFILTSYSPYKEDYCTKQYISNSNFISENINEEEFERILNKETGVLPVRFYTKTSILRILYEFDFEIIDFKKYHKIKNCKGFRDLLIVARKKRKQ